MDNTRGGRIRTMDGAIAQDAHGKMYTVAYHLKIISRRSSPRLKSIYRQIIKEFDY